MDRVLFLVPLHNLLEEPGVGTLRQALGLAAEHENGRSISFTRMPITRTNTSSGTPSFVRLSVSSLENASYHVRNTFLLEEAILYEAVQQDANYVVIGADTRARWRQILTHRLDLDIDLKAFLQRHLTATLVVV